MVEAITRWLEDHDRPDVHCRGRLLEVQEGRVEEVNRSDMLTLCQTGPREIRTMPLNRVLPYAACLLALSGIAACGSAAGATPGRNATATAVKSLT